MPTNQSGAPLKVLFVCVENSNRSQMAEAWARRLGGPRVLAMSAGSRPSGIINPKAIAAMAEVGCDLSLQRSKALTDLQNEVFDAVATMGCGDTCPNVRAAHRVDWSIPDPKTFDPPEFRRVRDEIRDHVAALLETLGVAPQRDVDVRV